MESLAKLFGSAARVKIMRLFLFNPEGGFDSSDISKHTRVVPREVRKEVALLEKIGMIKRAVFFKEFITKRGKLKETSKKRVKGFRLDNDFMYLQPLQSLLIHIAPLSNKQIISRLNGSGQIKLVIVSGVFIQNWDSRIDMLIVGDKLRMNAIEHVISVLEAEIGKELRVAVFETSDFVYRMGVLDRLVRDILDFPHQKIIDKIGIELPKPIHDV